MRDLFGRLLCWIAGDRRWLAWLHDWVSAEPLCPDLDICMACAKIRKHRPGCGVRRDAR
jgi:hypothetical protein